MLFYADENFPLAVVVELRGLKHDVLTAFEDDRANRKIPDDKVLKRAAELGRAVLTINRRDFKTFTKSTITTRAFLSALSTPVSADKPE